MAISIRVARMEDVPTLQQLIPESAQELSKGFYTEQQAESAITYIFGVDTQLVKDETYYVTEAEVTIVGCGGWSKEKPCSAEYILLHSQNCVGGGSPPSQAALFNVPGITDVRWRVLP